MVVVPYQRWDYSVSVIVKLPQILFGIKNDNKHQKILNNSLHSLTDKQWRGTTLIWCNFSKMLIQGYIFGIVTKILRKTFVISWCSNINMVPMDTLM